MEALFLKLVNLGITAGWLILAVLVARQIFRKAPKWTFCVLWGFVALRLICPVSFESALSLIPSATTIDTTAYVGRPHIEIGFSAVDTQINGYLESNYYEGVTVPANLFENVMTVLGWIWFAGMVVMLAYAAVSYILLRRRVSTATLMGKNIRQSEYVGSPFVLGLFRPIIFLPYQIDDSVLEYVIAHEQAHICRRDHWWKAIGFVILSVYWFHPLLWIAYVLFCRDIEAACDEKVIREMEKEERRAYSTALLNCSVHSRRVAAYPLAFGEIGVKDRVKNVMNYKKPAFWVVAVTVIACVIVAVCFLSNPTRQRDTLVWAQELHADDVVSADLVVFPQPEEKQFKALSEDEISGMAALINQSKGKYRAKYEEITGGSIFFYITMKDGQTHSVGNVGNVYLVIDGDYYEADYAWLVTWDGDFGEGNAPLPDNYF